MTIDGNKPPKFDDDSLELMPLFDLPKPKALDGQQDTEKKTKKRSLDIFLDSKLDGPFYEGRFEKKQRLSLRKSVKGQAKFPMIYPKIVDNEIVGKVVCINGVEYPIKEIAKGVFHKVFEFTTDLVPVDLEDDEGAVILKGFNSLKDPVTLYQTRTEDIIAYDKLNEDGVPQPKVYIRPDQFEDTQNKKYGDFWIVERLDAQAPIEEQYVLDFVKYWITESVNKKREIIPDFYPRNVMVKNDQCYIVDPSYVKFEEEWLENIFGFVIAWSNGKQETYDFLTADFPKECKDIYDAWLEKKKQDNDDQFPVTDQSKTS